MTAYVNIRAGEALYAVSSFVDDTESAVRVREDVYMYV